MLSVTILFLNGLIIHSLFWGLNEILVENWVSYQQSGDHQTKSVASNLFGYPIPTSKTSRHRAIARKPTWCEHIIRYKLSLVRSRKNLSHFFQSFWFSAWREYVRIFVLVSTDLLNIWIALIFAIKALVWTQKDVPQRVIPQPAHITREITLKFYLLTLGTCKMSGKFRSDKFIWR